MNFFTVGFALTAVAIQADFAAGYVIRLIGALFLIGGANETEFVTKGFLPYKKPAAAIVALCACAAATVLFTGGGVKKYAAISLSFAITASILLLQRSILLKIKKRHELVNDPSLIDSLIRVWDKMAFFCALTFVCEAFSRLLPSCKARVYIETVLVFARIIYYVYIILMARAFNRVRDDFNALHPT